MNYTTREIEELVAIAKEVDRDETIDWDELNITENDAYRMMAANVLEMDPDSKVQQGVIVKLLVENFVLNLKLMGKK